LRAYWDKHVQILSNKFIYHNNIGIDYVKPIIHILNKQQFIYDGSEAESRNFKSNTIIMGDILEDVKMVRESKHEVILKIGFMNDPIANAHLMESFRDTFDIVISGDGSLEPITYML
jgi:Pyrimidine 5'-nucleotidase (UMPH-1)